MWIKEGDVEYGRAVVNIPCRRSFYMLGLAFKIYIFHECHFSTFMKQAVESNIV